MLGKNLRSHLLQPRTHRLEQRLVLRPLLWYLHRGVVLTKDNLARRNWPGSKKCCFCTHDETIKHLFFQCKFARSTWSVIQIASNLYPPTSVGGILDFQIFLLLLVGTSDCMSARYIESTERPICIRQQVLPIYMVTGLPVYQILLVL